MPKPDSLLAKSIHTLHIDEPPSCILFAPHDRNLIVVGTYLYKPDEGTKTGHILLYKKQENSQFVINGSGNCVTLFLRTQFST
ncbi:hypothetical protein BDZ91DRAFT_15222 [Kalaharituber pfeilii]|nr:hypothetical protein BDZ91DRAFT_15222 [Kalaharituber pfeilii]